MQMHFRLDVLEVASLLRKFGTPPRRPRVCLLPDLRLQRRQRLRRRRLLLRFPLQPALTLRDMRCTCKRKETQRKVKKRKKS